MTPIERLLANPWGPHDLETHELSCSLRNGPVEGKLVLISLPGGRCALGQLPIAWPGPVERIGPEYDSVLEGERDVLRRRWEARQ